jgi:hypothetical protein
MRSRFAVSIDPPVERGQPCGCIPKSRMGFRRELTDVSKRSARRPHALSLQPRTTVIVVSLTSSRRAGVLTREHRPLGCSPLDQLECHRRKREAPNPWR